MANYMQHYLNKNIFKVSNPPGGVSSIKIGWDEPVKTIPQNIPQKRNHNNAYVNENNSYVGNQQAHNNMKRNPSYMNNPGLNKSHNYSLQNSQQYNRKNNDYDHPILGNKISTPFGYKKKAYQQYLNPNFVEPKIVDYPSQTPIHNWKQSASLLEQQLKYYQEKNKLLKQKLFGGYKNDDVLNKYQGDYHSNRRKTLSYQQPEELDLALKQRQKNMQYQYNQKYRHQSLDKNKFQKSSLYQYDSFNTNNSAIMQRNQPVKTSVVVHAPPGGFSSIKFG